MRHLLYAAIVGALPISHHHFRPMDIGQISSPHPLVKLTSSNWTELSKQNGLGAFKRCSSYFFRSKRYAPPSKRKFGFLVDGDNGDGVAGVHIVTRKMVSILFAKTYADATVDKHTRPEEGDVYVFMLPKSETVATKRCLPGMFKTY